jgi:chromosome segregation ATPase
MLERVFEGGKGIGPGHSVAWHDRFMVDWARARREAIRKQAELRRRLTAAEQRRRLTAAEQALDDAHAQVQRAEAAFDAASDRFAQAESALDVARAERARSREERYRARQACERGRHSSGTAPAAGGRTR